MFDFEPPWYFVAIYPEEPYCACSGYDMAVFLHPIHGPHLQYVVVDRGGCSKLIEALTHLIQPESSMHGTARRCHKLCTATAHGHPTLLCTDLFETVIECTATNHVIFS